MLRASLPKYSRLLNHSRASISSKAIRISRKSMPRIIPVITGEKTYMERYSGTPPSKNGQRGFAWPFLHMAYRKISFHGIVCIHGIQLLKMVTIAPFHPGFPFSTYLPPTSLCKSPMPSSAGPWKKLRVATLSIAWCFAVIAGCVGE